MMTRALDWVRACVQLAWWDGSSVDLRLHRLADLIDFVAATPEARPVLALAHRGERA
ncbi:hypothetical protein G3T14_19000 [Methylobacterium sp. BTF04]|uniref:hypothetical protein n=1 Tax=Methylobacterium sp. BTF04 TaxID=2708300 RepID=UPI0013CF82C8|nr:hypothetical protein [Methylobacterium sp. BTF04]NEU14201.1 hypothetical protein [Methylobacterium sp. BTF04]